MFGREVERRRKVAVVGKAYTTLGRVPWDDEEWDIWGLNDGPQTLVLDGAALRWDACFQLHPRAQLETQNLGHVAWLQTTEIPVYMLQEWPDIPASVTYPLGAIGERFGLYLTSSIAYMIALAIQFEYETIGVYGVDMATATEYSEQRACCEYYIGLARGMGIEVDIPAESGLLSCPYIYGIERPDDCHAPADTEIIRLVRTKKVRFELTKGI